MVETWYAILWLMLTAYVVLDGRNFGAGALHLLVAQTGAERRQVVAAIGPLWSWHEVWLIAAGGVLLAIFPRVLAAAFSAYYLALFLVLWSLILRGVALEIGGHINNPLWQSFWDFVFAVSNILLAVVFGTALGNVIRGVPLDASGKFHMAFFTDFGVRGDVGLLDWYTVSVGVFALLTLSAHGAAYLAFKTAGPVHEQSETLARWLWPVVFVLLVVITVQTWYVRPDLFGSMWRRPPAWLAIVIAMAGAAAVCSGLRSRVALRAFVGSCLLIAGLLTGAAAALFPALLYSTLSAEHSLTAYNSSASEHSLAVAMIWWPIAFVLALTYAAFILRHYRGTVMPSDHSQALYGEEGASETGIRF
jgi:cytochrome d ubiquinol oxidase subunit II